MKFLNKSLALLLALTLSFPSYAAVPTVMSDLSTTAASNSPAGSEAPTSIDDFLRAIQSIVRHTNAKGADIASATTTNIGAATGEFVDVTGTTTITGLGTIAAGIERTVRFTGALTLTHNATSLILPGGANITTAANHVAVFRSLGSGNWICVSYTKADGTSIVGGPFIDSTAIIKGSSDATKLIRMEADGITTGTTRVITMPDKDVNLGSATTSAEGLVELATSAEVQTGTSTTLVPSVSSLQASKIVAGTPVATTSGTTHDFTGIPAYVKRITMMLNGVSTNGTSQLLIQLGDAGGVETTTYVVTASDFVNTTVPNVSGATSGFQIGSVVVAAATTITGQITFTLSDSSTFLWTGCGMATQTNDNRQRFTCGQKALSAALDRIRLTTVSGDTFDAGSVNILTE